jgi:hypothetical protein
MGKNPYLVKDIVLFLLLSGFFFSALWFINLFSPIINLGVSMFVAIVLVETTRDKK